MPDIDVAAATAALEASGGMPDTVPISGSQYNRDGTTGRFASTQSEPVTPESEPVVEPTAPVTDAEPSFTHITDEAILNGEVTPEQLLAYKRAMNADYTQKTQEAAPWRKLAEATGVQSPDELQAAAELYAQLQNPANLPQFHQELTAHLERYGMTPAQASQAAAEQLAAVSPEEDYTGYEEEGTGVSPQVIAAIQAQQKQIQALTESLQQRDQQAALSAQQQAIAESLTRQEEAIVEASKAGGRPGYSPEAIEAIYAMMGPDGDLMAAEQRFQSLIGNEVQRYIGQKTQAVETTPHAVSGNQVQSSEPPKAMSWDEAHKAAMAYVERVETE